MTNEDIIRSAILAEAKKHGLIDDLLLEGLPSDLDERAAKLTVTDGKVSRSAVESIVFQFRAAKPDYFNETDASKLKAAEFDELEQQLRGHRDRRVSNLPDALNQLDSTRLTSEELDALGQVLANSGDWSDRATVEAAGRKQGLELHLDGPVLDDFITVP